MPAESLASAQDDFAAGRFNACARSMYYAAFQAAIAALIGEGIVPPGRWEHAFVRAEFSGRLIYRRKLYPSTYRTLLHEAFDIRARADYSERMLGRNSVNQLLQSVTRLVGEVKETSNGNR